MSTFSVAIIGGGLAGCECAHILAKSGIRVTLFEMRPEKFSEAHRTPDFAELVCSNSFRSDSRESAVGQLKKEMRLLESLCMNIAEKTRVPAGKALAVDRALFSRKVTESIKSSPLITIIHKEITDLDMSSGSLLHDFDAVVITAGPLASEGLTDSLQKLTGEGQLYFYDAIAPVVDGASVNMDTAFWGARYQPEDPDYLNCPMNKDEYITFYQALLEGEKTPTRDFEKEKHFEGCMPIEALAARGEKTLAFGPLKPVGFIDPRTGKRPYALLQLRTENINKSMFNLVGCQTKLTYPEQKRIFRMIPGLEKAEFVRFGSMHRNSFINAPLALTKDLSLKANPKIYIAGQLSGVEGYVESAAIGLLLGLILTAKANNSVFELPPSETALGALLSHLSTPSKNFQPSNVQFGLMPELGEKAKKAHRKTLYADRSESCFHKWISRRNHD